MRNRITARVVLLYYSLFILLSCILQTGFVLYADTLSEDKGVVWLTDSNLNVSFKTADIYDEVLVKDSADSEWTVVSGLDAIKEKYKDGKTILVSTVFDDLLAALSEGSSFNTENYCKDIISWAKNNKDFKVIFLTLPLVNGDYTKDGTTISADAVNKEIKSFNKYLVKSKDCDVIDVCSYLNGVGYDTFNGYTLDSVSTKRFYDFVTGCFSEGEGVIESNDTYYYYSNNSFNSKHSGLFDYNRYKIYFTRGTADIDYTGLLVVDDTTYFISSGLCDTQFSGITSIDGINYWIDNGILTYKTNGTKEYNGISWIVTNSVAKPNIDETKYPVHILNWENSKIAYLPSKEDVELSLHGIENLVSNYEILNVNASKDFREVSSGTNQYYSSAKAYLIEHDIWNDVLEASIVKDGVSVTSANDDWKLPKNTVRKSDCVMMLCKAVFGNRSGRAVVYNSGEEYYTYIPDDVYEIYFKEALDRGVLLQSEFVRNSTFVSQYKSYTQNSAPDWARSHGMIASDWGSALGASYTLSDTGFKRAMPKYFGDEEEMTMLDALELIARFMRLSEKDMTDTEAKIVSYKYGVNYLQGLSDDEFNTVAFLIAKGVLNFEQDDLNVYAEVKYSDLIPIIYRVANKDARYDFSIIQLTDDDNFWINNGFSQNTFTLQFMNSEYVNEIESVTVEGALGDPGEDAEEASLLGIETVKAAEEEKKYVVKKLFYENEDVVYTYEGTEISLLTILSNKDVVFNTKNGDYREVTFKVQAASEERAIQKVESKIAIANTLKPGDAGYKKSVIINGVTKYDTDDGIITLVSKSSLQQAFSDELSFVSDKIIQNKNTGAYAALLTDSNCALVGNEIIKTDYLMITEGVAEIYYNLDIISSVLGLSITREYYNAIGGTAVSAYTDTFKVFQSVDAGVEYPMSVEYLISSKSDNAILSSKPSNPNSKDNRFYYNVNQLTQGLSTLVRTFPVQGLNTKENATMTVVVDFVYAVPGHKDLGGWFSDLKKLETNGYKGENSLYSIYEQFYTRPTSTQVSDPDALKKYQDYWDSNIAMTNSLVNWMFETSGVEYIKSGFIVPQISFLVSDNVLPSGSTLTCEKVAKLSNAVGFKFPEAYKQYVNNSVNNWVSDYFIDAVGLPDVAYGDVEDPNKDWSSVRAFAKRYRSVHLYEGTATDKATHTVTYKLVPTNSSVATDNPTEVKGAPNFVKVNVGSDKNKTSLSTGILYRDLIADKIRLLPYSATEVTDDYALSNGKLDKYKVLGRMATYKEVPNETIINYKGTKWLLVDNNVIVPAYAGANEPLARLIPLDSAVINSLPLVTKIATIDNYRYNPSAKVGGAEVDALPNMKDEFTSRMEQIYMDYFAAGFMFRDKSVQLDKLFKLDNNYTFGSYSRNNSSTSLDIVAEYWNNANVNWYYTFDNNKPEAAKFSGSGTPFSKDLSDEINPKVLPVFAVSKKYYDIYEAASGGYTMSTKTYWSDLAHVSVFYSGIVNDVVQSLIAREVGTTEVGRLSAGTTLIINDTTWKKRDGHWISSEIPAIKSGNSDIVSIAKNKSAKEALCALFSTTNVRCDSIYTPLMNYVDSATATFTKDNKVVFVADFNETLLAYSISPDNSIYKFCNSTTASVLSGTDYSFLYESLNYEDSVDKTVYLSQSSFEMTSAYTSMAEGFVEEFGKVFRANAIRLGFVLIIIAASWMLIVTWGVYLALTKDAGSWLFEGIAGKDRTGAIHGIDLIKILSGTMYSVTSPPSFSKALFVTIICVIIDAVCMMFLQAG